MLANILCLQCSAELDKLLEDTPIPLVAQHAAKLSGVRKRVASLMSTLRIIQGRITNMDRMLNTCGKEILFKTTIYNFACW